MKISMSANGGEDVVNEHPHHIFKPTELDANKRSGFKEAKESVFIEPRVTIFDSEQNGKIELHPTTFELAILSALVYHYRTWNQQDNFVSYAIETQEKSEEKVKLQEDILKRLQEFQLIYDGKDKRTGLNAVCLYRKKSDTRHHQVVIAFEGTKLRDLKQLKADLEGIAENKLIPIIISVMTFTLRFLNDFLANINDIEVDRSKLHLTITGHSLGGWLAQLSTFAVQNMRIVENSFEVNPLQECQVYPHCEVFDSPGTLQILVGICHHVLKTVDKKINVTDVLPQLNVSNFVLTPNVINATNDSVGQMYLLLHPENESFPSVGIREGVSKYHRIGVIIETIRAIHKNYKNIKQFLLTEWPLIIWEGYNTKRSSMCKRKNLLTTICKMSWDTIRDKSYAEIRNFKPRKPVDLQETVCMSALNRNEKIVLKYLDSLIPLKANNPKLCIDKWIGILVEDLQYHHDRYITENMNSVKLTNRSNYLLFKNAALASFELKKRLENLYDFKKSYYITVSDANIKLIQSEIISLKIEIEPCPWLGKSEIFFSNKSTAKLFKLHIATCMANEKYGLNKTNTLILSYNEFTSWGSVDESLNFDFIFVDCLDYQGERTQHFKAKFIMLSDNANKTENIKLLSSDKNELLSHNIKIQGGLEGRLSDWLDFENNDIPDRLFDILNNSIIANDVIPSLLRKSSDCDDQLSVDVGQKSPSICSDLGLYFEPNKKFESIADSLAYFERMLIRPKLFYYSQDKQTQLVLQKEFEQQNLEHCSLINYSSSSNITESFQSRCESVSNFANLLEVSIHGGIKIVQWVLHFNSNFYQKRKIHPPPLNLRSLNLNGLGLKINSQMVVDVNQSLGCRNVLKPEIHIEDLFPMICSQSYDYIGMTQAKEKSYKINISKSGSLRENISKAIPSKDPVDENELISNSDILILADEPGMGKSLSMLTLSSNLMNAKTHWVLYQQLKLFSHWELVKETIEEEKIQLFLKNNLVDEKEDIISGMVFDYIFKNEEKSDKLAFIFDGFDELLPNEKKIMSNILKFLREKKKSKIVISSRTHDQNRLEKGLGVLSHTFVPLNNFKHTLQIGWDGLVIRENRNERKYFETFCEKIKQKTDNVITNSNVVVGIPLHLKMICNVFLDDVVKYVANAGDMSDGIDALFDQYTLGKLYTKYVENKYKIYYHQKLQVRKEYFEKLDKSKYQYAMQSLAAEAIIGEKDKDFGDLFWDTFKITHAITENTSLMEELYAIGIVKYSNDPQLRFIHRSVAEFYVAQFLFSAMKVRLIEKDRVVSKPDFQKIFFIVFTKMLFQNNQFVVRGFFNEFICDDQQMLDDITHFRLKYLVSEDVHEDVSKTLSGFDINYLFREVIKYQDNSFFSLFLQTIDPGTTLIERQIKILQPTFVSILLSKSQHLSRLIVLANVFKKRTGKEWIDIEFFGDYVSDPIDNHLYTSVPFRVYSLRRLPDHADPIFTAIRRKYPDWSVRVTEYLNNLVDGSHNSLIGGHEYFNLPAIELANDMTYSIEECFRQLEIVDDSTKMSVYNYIDKEKNLSDLFRTDNKTESYRNKMI